MVTVFVKKNNTLSQEFYDSIVDGINFSSVHCTCGHCGCLTRHAYYYRIVRFKSSVVVLKILRVKCSQCGKTHAVLLSSIVPYSQIPLEDQIEIISNYDSGSDFMAVLDSNFLIDPREVYRIISNYRRFWKQRLISEKITSFENIVTDCFRLFDLQFMQIRWSPGILFC